MSTVQCFMIEPTGMGRVSLRAEGDRGECPKSEWGHRGESSVGLWSVMPDERGLLRISPISETALMAQTEIWPTHCDECGAELPTGDDLFRTVDATPLYRRTDTGEEIGGIQDAPIGAMWYSDWQLVHSKGRSGPGTYCGPDGHCLSVKCPDGRTWCIDGTSSNGPGWTRTGTPPNITANPSIWTLPPDGYHGWLRNGVFESV